MRVIACIGVVCIHVFKTAHDVCVDISDPVSFLCMSVVNNLGWCVPVFLMITGSLLLNPEKEMPIRKIGAYIWRIALVLIIAGTLFALMELVFNARSFSGRMLLSAFVNVLTGNSWNHLWYLYALIVLYCFLPLLKALVSWKKVSQSKFICWMMVLYASVLPMLKALGINLGIAVDAVSIYMLYPFPHGVY